ncbi:TPA: hypothetical protein QCU24_004168 [Bacillus cereus]|nr:hypothetical protein [Bacillus cereus]
MDKNYVDKRVSELENQVWGLKQTVADLSSTVSMLSEVVKTKEDKQMLVEVPVVLNGKEIARKVSEFTEIKERF